MTVRDDPCMEPPEGSGAESDGALDARGRRRAVAVAGHQGDEGTARHGTGDVDPMVRALSVGALGRLGSLTAADLLAALGDEAAVVRRRACEEAGRGPSGEDVDESLVARLDDPDPLVTEAAAAALGERGAVAAVGRLSMVVAGHPDARCREAAVAALGALGHPDGRAAVLGALDDRPPVRRRAVVALAAFSGPEVEAALQAALADKDWQVRQAAETLLEG